MIDAAVKLQSVTLRLGLLYAKWQKAHTAYEATPRNAPQSASQQLRDATRLFEKIRNEFEAIENSISLSAMMKSDPAHYNRLVRQMKTCREMISAVDSAKQY